MFSTLSLAQSFRAYDYLRKKSELEVPVLWPHVIRLSCICNCRQFPVLGTPDLISQSVKSFSILSLRSTNACSQICRLAGYSYRPTCRVSHWGIHVSIHQRSKSSFATTVFTLRYLTSKVCSALDYGCDDQSIQCCFSFMEILEPHFINDFKIGHLMMLSSPLIDVKRFVGELMSCVHKS